MTTRLDKALKREVDINDVTYTVTIAPEGLKIVEKGKRKGQEISWQDLLGGSVALTRDLRASLTPPGDSQEGADEP
ncbi:MAG: hypothetical protein ACT4R6_04280 [Gemmatimonadaceae bacterium]